MRNFFRAFLLLSILAAFVPSPAKAQITLRQTAFSATCGAGVTTCATAAFGVNTAAGSSIIVCVAGNQTSGSTNALSSVTGQGTFVVNSSTLVNSGASTHYTNLFAECAVATGITGGATTAETCHVSTAMAGGCTAYEVKGQGLGGSTLFSTGTAASGTAVSAGSVTTTVNGAFAVTAAMVDDGIGGGTIFGTQGAGWTKGQGIGGGNYDAGSQYIAQSSAGNLTGSLTASHTGAWAASMIVVEPLASGHCAACDVSKLQTVHRRQHES